MNFITVTEVTGRKHGFLSTRVAMVDNEDGETRIQFNVKNLRPLFVKESVAEVVTQLNKGSL